jgi:hypothetical protein
MEQMQKTKAESQEAEGEAASETNKVQFVW